MADRIERETDPREETKGVGREVGEVATRAKEKTAEALHERKNAIAEEVLAIARALEAAADTMMKEGHRAAARYSSQLSEAVESVGHSLEHKSLSDLMSELESMAERRPALLAGGFALLGFAATRFLRSSPEEGTEPSVSTTGELEDVR